MLIRHTRCTMFCQAQGLSLSSVGSPGAHRVNVRLFQRTQARHSQPFKLGSAQGLVQISISLPPQTISRTVLGALRGLSKGHTERK